MGRRNPVITGIQRKNRLATGINSVCAGVLTAVLAVLLPAPAAHAQDTASPGASAPTPVDPDAPIVVRRLRLRFVTGTDYPPFNYRDEDATLTGFNVDVARAICFELDADCAITARPWNEIGRAVEQSEADAAIASIAIKADTLARFDFSIPYHFTPARFAVRNNADKFGLSPEELAGRRVGTTAGTAHEAYIRTFFPDAEIATYRTPVQTRDALRLGKIGLLFGDAAELALWLNGTSSRGCCSFRGDAYYEPLFFGDGVAIAVARGNHALLEKLNRAITAIRRTGRLEEIFLRYFPIKLY